MLCVMFLKYSGHAMLNVFDTLYMLCVMFLTCCGDAMCDVFEMLWTYYA